MKTKITIIPALLIAMTQAFAQKPASHTHLEWEKLESYSDEFNSLDLEKWTNDPNDWGTWSWEPELAYVENGELKIKMIQEDHQRNGQDLFYKSGIIRQGQAITYGYFETRIKGSERFPGACPAFWLYSIGQPDPTEEGQSKYSEIDVVELTQREWSQETKDWEGPEVIDMNLHAIVLKDGKMKEIRPGSSPDIARNKWHADFDPRDDYHTYGVLSRVDSVFWYVDGIERGRKENLYWNLPMHITVSMGLRSPFEKYIDGVRQPDPEATTTEGFPTQMYCDYVRVWTAAPQIVSNAAQYTTTPINKNTPFFFDCYYDAGSGYVALSPMSVQLIEKNAEGNTVKAYASTENSILGKPAGKLKIALDLTEVIPSNQLPEGHYYDIEANFKTGKEDQNVVLSEAISRVEIIDQITAIEPVSPQLNLYPNPVFESLQLTGITANAMLQIYDLNGNMHLEKTATSESLSINVKNLPRGEYILKVTTPNSVKALRFIKH